MVLDSAEEFVPDTVVGMIGVGTIAEALTVGLCGFTDRRATVLLSPRNLLRSNRLAQQFSQVHVAADNQAVVDGSNVVVLAVRPQVAAEVLGALRFRPDQEIVSLIATYRMEQLLPLVAPAKAVSRAVPLPPIARRQGPLALYTESPTIVRLLDGLGRLILVEQEAHLDLISAVTSLMGAYFGMAEAMDGWMVERGFQPQAARTFVAELFFTLAHAAKHGSGAPFSDLVVEHSTPGGLNEQAWRELRAVGWADGIGAALDLVLDRIHGRATFESRLPSSRE